MGFGSLENPYVENPFAGRIIDVHWRTPSTPIGGTCEGNIGFIIGFGTWTGTIGIIDWATGTIYASFPISLTDPGGFAEARSSFSVSASGALALGQGVGLTAFVNGSGVNV